MITTVFLASLILAIIATTVAAAAAAPSQGTATISNVYIVQLMGPPLADRNTNAKTSKLDASSMQAHSSYLTQLHDSILEEALEPGSYKKLYSYTMVLNAFAVQLTEEDQVSTLNAHHSVVRIESEAIFKKTTTYTPQFLGLHRGPWHANGGVQYAGENIVIGILDTGIDPTHPSFANHARSRSYKFLKGWDGKCSVSDTFPPGSCNGKIVAARYFAKGIIAASAFNATYDFASPLDGDGHGTHTSSIAAGNHGVPVSVNGYNYGRASGMAPRARLAVYKVIYRNGGFLSDVLAGVDQAVQDGVDILSLSLGSTSSGNVVPFLNSFDIALLFAVKAGALVVHAAGNNGPAPSTVNSFGPWLMTVGSANTDRSYLNPVILRSKEIFLGIGLSAGTPKGRLYRLIYSKDAFTDLKGSFDPDYYSSCPDPSPFNKTLVKGKILICNLIDLFSGGFGTQIEAALKTAYKLRATGLIIVAQTSELGQEKSMIMDPVPLFLPATIIADGNSSALILQYYNENTARDEHGKAKDFNASAWLKDSRVPSFKNEAPEVAYYSSRGPILADTASSVYADTLKPDILAPGSQIWGAWTPIAVDSISYKGQKFAILSGTSMATPHIAGIAALLKRSRPEWTNSDIRSALLTTSSPFDNRGKLISSQQPSLNTSLVLGKATPFDFGAGAVNATAALDPGLVFHVGFQDYINFLCTVPGADINSVEAATGATCKTTRGQRSSDLNLPSITVANLVGSRTVKRKVTSVAKSQGGERYRARVDAPEGVEVKVRPSSFTIRTGETKRLRVVLRAKQMNQAFTFGSVTWVGGNGHVVRMQLAISANSVIA